MGSAKRKREFFYLSDTKEILKISARNSILFVGEYYG
jgi:hypothetical protein